MDKSEVIVAEMLEKQSVIEGIERRLGSERPYKPYITFSREPGSGGKPIAQLVAKEMGFKLHDRKLVEEVAQKIHTSVGAIRQVDERHHSKIMEFVQGALNPDYISNEVYFRNLCQVILNLVSKGGIVIVGRGANFIAPKAYGLQVRITAPYRVRVARAIEFEKIEYEEARKRIKETGEERELFVKEQFGKDIARSKYYDLTINTTFYSVKQAADLVMAAYKLKYPKGRVTF